MSETALKGIEVTPAFVFINTAASSQMLLYRSDKFLRLRCHQESSFSGHDFKNQLYHRNYFNLGKRTGFEGSNWDRPRLEIDKTMTFLTVILVKILEPSLHRFSRYFFPDVLRRYPTCMVWWFLRGFCACANLFCCFLCFRKSGR